jgi:hypothetical protein
MIHYGLGIAEVKGEMTALNVDELLESRFTPQDADTIEIDRLLIDEGMSPEEAANHMLMNGIPRRRSEGLKTLARRRESIILEYFYGSEDDLVGKISATGSSEVHFRRARSVMRKAQDAGLDVECVVLIRIRD